MTCTHDLAPDVCLADAMLAGFVVVVSFFSQVWLLSCLSSSLCKNSNEFYVGFVYSSLLVFWTPTCRAESIFATTAFTQLMMLLTEWERICKEGGRFGQTSFSILFIFYFKVGHFFSPVVLEIHMYYNRKNILFYNKKKNHINSLQHEEKERNRNPSDDRNFFSFVIHECLISHHLSSFCIVILKYII